MFSQLTEIFWDLILQFNYQPDSGEFRMLYQVESFRASDKITECI